jgi:uncharacterized membrane protein YcjF (UPF0283 family)
MDDFALREEPVSAGERTSARGIGDLLRAIAFDVQDLVLGEVSLAKAEMDQKLQRSITALVWIMGGMLLGFAALVIILQAGVDALARANLPVWAASLIVGVIVALIGAAIAYSGIKMLSLDRLAPRRTARSLKADAQLVKEHT